MPRSGWIAVGVVLAALGAELIGLRFVAGMLALAGATVMVLLGAAGPRARRVAGPAAVVVLAGAALAVRLTVLPAEPLGETPLPTDRGPWTAVVVGTGSPREGQQQATIRLIDGSPGLSLAATLPRYPAVVPGQRVLVGGAVQPRPASPYGTYLERIGVGGTLRAASLEVSHAPLEPTLALESVRRGAADLLARVLPEPEAGLAAGILIGLRDRVDREVAADFTTAGVSHVVAISGWNIAIVAAAVAALGGALGRRRRSVLTLVAIVVYVVFAGGSPSVVRAAAMAGVVLLARESGRAGRAAAALGWAVAILLLVDPALIADAGFQLSSTATAGLIAWAGPLTDRIRGIGGGRVPGWLAESLGVSLAAQAATLPIVLSTFGRLAIISPVANLFIVPVVPIAMAAGLLAFGGAAAVAGGLHGVVGVILALPGWLSLTVNDAIARISADLPFASATLEPPLNVVAALAACAGLVGVVWWRRRNGNGGSRPPPSSAIGRPARPASSRPRVSRVTRLAVGALVSALILAGAVIVERPNGASTVTVLDVGQGDAILVEGTNGGRLLVDGGPDPDRLLVELDRRLPPWDRRIDAVVLTHPHEDHVAGLAMLLERYDVGETFEPGMRGPGPGYAAWAARLAGRGPTGRTLAAGDRLHVDGIRLDVLWPAAGSVPADPPDTGTAINNVSIVLLGTVDGRRFLLAGDVEEEVDPELLGAVGRVDLLKVAHHGSRTASTDAFLDTVTPAVAVTSSGAGNRYGHPAPETLDRLAARGAKVFRTDRDGSVTVSFDRAGVTVRTTGGRARPTPRPTASARAAARGPVAAVLPSFLCGIPSPLATARSTNRPPIAAAPTTVRLADHSLYHRADDGSRADRGRQPAALARSTRVAPASFARGRRGGRVPRAAGGRSRRPGGPAPRGDGSAPARRRQGAPRLRCPTRAPPRPRIRGLARGRRLSGARGRGRDAPGDPAA